FPLRMMRAGVTEDPGSFLLATTNYPSMPQEQPQAHVLPATATRSILPTIAFTSVIAGLTINLAFDTSD
ncbi:MAG: hypothetical protein WAU28_05140, partial [Candidatus Moraniibacteriota bacterium]